ncbi:alpha/beta fold hydrolase [Actinomycetospora soli]|uniref:alpha/beta fold hydrolase n=1 Tax=Actinomycetospora soli TaxID=2893887 RepID=UPI001E40A5FE|nr:alpha/beta hydrolase [Actinomycetospora soli]MCD2188060.1 alpha/beta hydrolase [Actinomycetospora soli]
MLRRRVPVAPPAVLRRGAGPPTVVAVPGNGLSVDGWRAPTRLLGPDAAVVALPAHGLPARRDDRLDPGTNAERLLARLDDLGVRRTVLLGHSASCQVVAEAARRAPERVTGLVLVGPTTDPRAPTWPRLAGRWLATAVHERAGQVPLLARDYTHCGLITFARAMERARQHAIGDALAATTHPVLLVRGPDDHIAPADWLDRLAALRPGITATTLSAGAHMVPITHPHDLVAATGPFVARLRTR